MKAMHEEMLDNSIAKLIGSEHILATNALVTVKLMGGAPKTLKLSKTLALGLKDMELKWNVHLEEIRASPRMICMTGLVEMLDNSIAKLIGSEHILATNALVTVKLMGGAPKTLKLSKTLALGLKDM